VNAPDAELQIALSAIASTTFILRSYFGASAFLGANAA